MTVVAVFSLALGWFLGEKLSSGVIPASPVVLAESEQAGQCALQDRIEAQTEKEVYFVGCGGIF